MLKTSTFPLETVQFRLNLLLKQRILAVQHDFHWLLVATRFFAIVDSQTSFTLCEGVGFGKFCELGVGVEVGHFTSDSTTLIDATHCRCIVIILTQRLGSSHIRRRLKLFTCFNIPDSVWQSLGIAQKRLLFVGGETVYFYWLNFAIFRAISSV